MSKLCCIRTLKYLVISLNLLVFSLFISDTSDALLLTDSNGQIEFSVQQLDDNLDRNGSSRIGENGELISPGAWYPSTIGAIGPTQTMDGTLVPLLAMESNNALIGDGTFGGAGTNLLARGFPVGGGLFWTDSFVIDIEANDQASVNISQGAADFENNDPGILTGTAGAFLSVYGSIGNNGYVAASLSGSINGINFDPIIIASDGWGYLGDGVMTTGSGVLTETGFTFPGQNQFTAYGIDILSGDIIIEPGEAIRIEGTLSLIADPGATIYLGGLPDGVEIPDFGLFAYTPVPEPSSILVFSGGIALMVWLRKKNSLTH